MKNEIKKIQYESIQNDILKALNNVYLIQDSINDIVEELENITYEKDAKDMINDIRDEELNDICIQMEEMKKDLDEAMGLIYDVIDEVNK